MDRRTIVVEGPLAFRMRRLAAAQHHETGVDITALPLVAARLAGGFARSPMPQELFAGINTALEAGGFADFESLRLLPGMTRSLARTLTSVWLADFSLTSRTGDSKRLADLALIEQRVRASLPAGAHLPPDLRDAALANVAHARAVFGTIKLQRLTHIAPVWRPLINALAAATTVQWRHPGTDDHVWFKGEIIPGDQPMPAAPEVVSCVDPRAEVVEALRWARKLIATGRSPPGDIAIASASTHSWDEHVLSLAAHAELPLHSSHGVPAIACFEGQACGALADILLNGLSQGRVRRLLRHRACLGGALGDLPAAWNQGIPRDASLLDVGHWRRVLEIAGRDHVDRAAAHAALMPVLELLACGTSRAKEIGETILRGNARLLWTEALERAPASALEYALQEVRLPDGQDPGAAVVVVSGESPRGIPSPLCVAPGHECTLMAAAHAGGSTRPQPRRATRGNRSRPRRRAGPARVSARYQSRGRRLRTLKQSPERRRHLAGREPPGYRGIATPLAQAGPDTRPCRL